MTARVRIGRFNTQPPEGGWEGVPEEKQAVDGFNTQPPEGGWAIRRDNYRNLIGFNTQPPEGGWLPDEEVAFVADPFQHTAA